MQALARWMLDLFSAMAVLLGTFLVIYLSGHVYFLVTGRVQPDMEQPPLGVVVPLLIIGILLLVGGFALHKTLNKDSLF